MDNIKDFMADNERAAWLLGHGADRLDMQCGCRGLSNEVFHGWTV